MEMDFSKRPAGYSILEEKRRYNVREKMNIIYSILRKLLTVELLRSHAKNK